VGSQRRSVPGTRGPRNGLVSSFQEEMIFAAISTQPPRPHSCSPFLIRSLDETTLASQKPQMASYLLIILALLSINQLLKVARRLQRLQTNAQTGPQRFVAPPETQPEKIKPKIRRRS